MAQKPITISSITKEGTVVSTKMDKTIIVQIDRKLQHPIYRKTMKHSKRFKAHDEKNRCKLGDFVEISQCRPISKEKSWIVTQVIAAKKTI
ncbi:30S ribosomal protein S17 [Candidatus Wirthbacteria bacterium CG2_30_54_11]|uniref:Small ribosomal subunit protein uS17 n=1 Tax=Candidatus Wirthbacteria bacterium CG2_30_54_11 TaxID=1817892 RepID=A0A1J5ITW3_9BACT|nr:ribosomal protein S17 [uncultured bacterium]OIQ00549.1 MAG: 30S ribosomal protein S17 [Candidatus Wirthbacteria bacterium CG2_30_54_11]